MEYFKGEFMYLHTHIDKEVHFFFSFSPTKRKENENDFMAKLMNDINLPICFVYTLLGWNFFPKL
jgi:hypothetical protein